MTGPGDGTPELRPPRPAVTPTAQPFWDALRERRVVIQRCRSCREWVHYPRVRCPHCGRAQLAFEAADGRGRIYSFTVARQATAPHFAAEVPQLIAIVELDGAGIRLTTTLVEDDPAAIAIGDAVEPVFEDGEDGVTLLRYRRVAPT